MGEIGGAKDGRHSTSADQRSILTCLAPAPTFQPNRGLFVCDDNDVRLISRLSSASFLGAPQENCSTPGPNGPRVASSQSLRSSSFSSLLFAGHFSPHGYSFTEQQQDQM